VIPGFFTGGADVLGKHRYLLTAYYGLDRSRPAYVFLYQNDQGVPTVSLYASDLARLYSHLDMGSGFRVSNYWERQQQRGVDVTLPFRKILASQNLSIGLRETRMRGLVDVPVGFPPIAEGNMIGFRTAWGFGNARRYGRSISLEDGRQVLLAYEKMERRLGSDFDVGKTLLDWNEYLPLPGAHHILYLRALAGIGSGDLIAQRAFQLGGPSPQESLLTLDDRNIFLRGYPSALFQGQRVALGTLEYRFPLYNIERGPGTFPLFFKRLHGALFVDAGKTWDAGGLDLKDFNRGIGGEIRLDADIGYYLPVRFVIGITRGIDPGGETRILLGLTFVGGG
jgi:hypothetical protein